MPSKFILISAGAVIKNTDGKFFIAKRGENARDDQGTWEFPGGKVLPMETREAAMRRNIKDKYGIEVEIIKVLDVYDVIDHEAGDHWVSTTYLCNHASDEPQNLIPEKCDEISWFDLAEISKLPISRITKLNLATLQLKDYKTAF
jgi:8-oxo-dGTP diphosphatase